jgi:hypothetical protein
MLTSELLEEMRLGIDRVRIPRTILDAIQVVHRLGIDYLWVDALCIIQDSSDDKLYELPRMADIYRQSSLTIVAASSCSASEGFLSSPDPPTFFVEPFRINFSGSDGLSKSLTFGYRQMYKGTVDPINFRAWTLQERVLSPRLLIFSHTGVMWMCREWYMNLGSSPDAGPPYLTSLGPESSNEEVDETFIKKKWLTIRAEYTEMDMTYCSDKLSAISALAAEISRRTGWTYLAGLWEENLFSDLHWRCIKKPSSGQKFPYKSQRVLDAGYLAPSWSWASVGDGMIMDGEDGNQNRQVFDFEILQCRVIAVGDSTFSFGPVQSGFLDVEGRLIQLPWRYDDTDAWDCTYITLLDKDKTSVVGEATPDPLDEDIPPDTQLYCLGMSRFRLGRQRIIPVEGLILLPLDDSSTTFRRIGFCRLTCPSVFDNIIRRRLRIE